MDMVEKLNSKLLKKILNRNSYKIADKVTIIIAWTVIKDYGLFILLHAVSYEIKKQNFVVLPESKILTSSKYGATKSTKREGSSRLVCGCGYRMKQL